MINDKNTESSSHIETISIEISSIVQDPSYQIRGKLDYNTVTRYMDVLKSGRDMQAIKIAIVNGLPVLIDGWHRLAAMEALGTIHYVQAEVVRASKKEAKWLAAKANTEHGLPLKKGELVEVFKAYVRAGHHRNDNGTYKSYRDIGKELSKNHTTIRNWMIKHFRKIANAMGGDMDNTYNPPDEVDMDYLETLEFSFGDTLSKAISMFRSTDDPNLRGTMVGRLEDELNSMKRAGNWSQRDF